MWEVSWRLNKDCNIWPPALLAITALLSRSPGLLNRGPGGPAGSHCLKLQQLPSNSELQLSDFLSHPGYIILWHPPASWGVTICTQFNPSTVNVIPWYLRPDAPVIYTGAFLIWQLGRVGGQYVTSIKTRCAPLKDWIYVASYPSLMGWVSTYLSKGNIFSGTEFSNLNDLVNGFSTNSTASPAEE